MGPQFLNQEEYQLAALAYATKLSDVTSTIFALHQAISNLTTRLNESNSPERAQRLAEALISAKTNLLINQMIFNTMISGIAQLNQTYQTSFANAAPLFNKNQEPIVTAARIVDNNDLKPTMDTRLIEIRDKFDKVKEAASAYKTKPTRANFKAYEAIRRDFLSLRSNLSIRVNSAKRENEISQEDFQKFKKQQFELYKEQNAIHKSLTDFRKSKAATREKITPVKQTQKAAKPEIKPQVKPQAKPEVKSARQMANEATYGVNPQRMANSKAATKITARVNEHIPKARAASHGQNVLDREMKNINATMGTRNEEYKARVEQKKQQEKVEKKEARKAGLKRNVDPELLRQRDKLAFEIEQMKRMYGTANNEEYQARISQLKDLDKKIFGRKASRVYKDLSKPIALVGGDFIELPKDYVSMRVQHTEEKSK